MGNTSEIAQMGNISQVGNMSEIAHLGKIAYLGNILRKHKVEEKLFWFFNASRPHPPPAPGSLPGMAVALDFHQVYCTIEAPHLISPSLFIFESAQSWAAGRGRQGGTLLIAMCLHFINKEDSHLFFLSLLYHPIREEQGQMAFCSWSLSPVPKSYACSKSK